MDNYVGKRLDGRYEVQEIIGVGGMSVVYKAYDNVDDRIVAVKVLKEEFSNNEDFKRRFKNESKAIALLSHPNIVKVYDVNFGEKLQYIVMEYIDGITLKEYINKQGAITWNDALFFMTQILRAVQHAHDKGIVHRDIKPQNIILLRNGNIKVTDFGIARFSRSETKTLTEQAIGSVHYIAPEQAKGEYTDEKADIYSLGVVLYEMLAGDVPFEADSAVSVALMQLQADAQKLTDINPDIPLGLEQICIRAMQKNPVDRYQTATEMLFDIEEVIQNPQTTFNYVSKLDSNPTRVVRAGDISDSAQIGRLSRERDDDVIYEDPDRRKKKLTAVIIGLIVLIAAVVILVMAITKPINPNTSKLENFVGMSYDEVIEAAQKGVYSYNFIQETEKTGEAEPGVIIRQTPEAGAKVVEGTEVTLIVAASQNDITIPNVYGYTEEQAKKQLEAEGLSFFKVVSTPSENVDEGKVIYTDPKANTVTSADQEITIYISSGPTTTVIETVKVPDVTGLTQEGARAFLEKAGFKNVSFITQDSTYPKGVVISQSPGYGESIQSTDSIKVIISSGETTTTTAKQIKINVSVRIPKILDENGEPIKDTIIISVDGTSYTTKMLSLDGSTVNYSISGDGDGERKISIALKNTGAKDTQTVSGDKDESLKYSFKDFDHDGTTTTKKHKKEDTSDDSDNSDNNG